MAVRGFLDDDRATRPAILAVVVGAHLAALFIPLVSENCYMRPQNYAAQPGDPFAETPMTFCNFSLGKKQARGDLFEHLRKQPPVP